MDRPTPDIRALRENAIAECLELFDGDRDAAERWLSQPVRGLNYQLPCDLLSSEAGIEQLRTLIGQLEHGVFT